MPLAGGKWQVHVVDSRMLPDVQAQDGNALHLGNALHDTSCISQHEYQQKETICAYLQTSIAAGQRLSALYRLVSDLTQKSLGYNSLY